MPTDPAQLRISEIWRYPVKSLGGERLDGAHVAAEGIVGDRMWALVDDATGNIVSAKRVKLWAGLLLCRARLLDDAAPHELSALAIAFPDEDERPADDPRTLARLAELTGRPVHFQYATRAAKTMEMDWVAESQIGMAKAVEATSARVQQDGSEVPVGAVPTGGAGSRYHDLAPIHILTTSSIRQLAEGGQSAQVAGKKYRPNVVVGDDAWDAGYVEDAWLGSDVGVGAAALRPTTPVSRCVMVTLEHRDAPRDRAALRRIAQQHRVRTPYTTAPTPCLGLYADVTREGPIRVGDPVAVG